MCEAIERYSGMHRAETPEVRARLRDLDGRAYRPNDLMLISDDQFARRDAWNARHQASYHKFPVPFDDGDEVAWNPVWSMTAREVVYVPSAYCWYGHPDLAPSLYTLGVLLHARGEYRPALPYLEQALAMRQKLYPAARFPAGHPELAHSLHNLGSLLQARGEQGQALPYEGPETTNLVTTDRWGDIAEYTLTIEQFGYTIGTRGGAVYGITDRRNA